MPIAHQRNSEGPWFLRCLDEVSLSFPHGLRAEGKDCKLAKLSAPTINKPTLSAWSSWFNASRDDHSVTIFIRTNAYLCCHRHYTWRESVFDKQTIRNSWQCQQQSFLCLPTAQTWHIGILVTWSNVRRMIAWYVCQKGGGCFSFKIVLHFWRSCVSEQSIQIALMTNKSFVFSTDFVCKHQA